MVQHDSPARGGSDEPLEPPLDPPLNKVEIFLILPRGTIVNKGEYLPFYRHVR